MRKTNRKKLGDKSVEILKSIGDGVVDFVDVITSLSPDEYQSGAYRIRYRRVYKRTYDLKRAGFITTSKSDNKSFYRLTPKGKLEFLKILHLEKLFKSKWDGRWRIVIFDIPEAMKSRRDYIRMQLRELKFVQLQHSVYITPYPVTEELNQILTNWKIRECFRFLTVTEIDGEEKLKKEFALK